MIIFCANLYIKAQFNLLVPTSTINFFTIDGRRTFNSFFCDFFASSNSIKSIKNDAKERLCK